MMKSTSVLPLFFYMLIPGLIVLCGLIVVGRAWFSTRAKKRERPLVITSTEQESPSTSAVQLDPIAELPDLSIIRRPLLTPSEIRFLRALQDAVGPQYVIYTQIPLWTLVDTETENKKSSIIFRNRISLKRVDFVVMNAASMDLHAVVELDDRSHEQKDRIKRDAFVAAVLERAKIPLVRIPVAATYSSLKLRQVLNIDLPQSRLA
ncbi:MAG: hypothetical protein LZF60_360096 [Nitrospira sp.]|nr:MAG: hypothetical protein LZF60_360096 [Nitrospira sp.]